MTWLTPARAWPLAIVAVLALTVAANVALFAAANAPGSAVPEADYYRRALAWDSTQAERSRSAALGWTANAAFVTGGDGGARLQVTLLDAAGAPVEGARVAVAGVHNLEPGATQHWPLARSGPGGYSAAVRPRHAGRWELTVEAVRDADRFVTVLHADAGGHMQGLALIMQTEADTFQAKPFDPVRPEVRFRR